MSVDPRHIVLLSVLTIGSALLGASAHGIARLDDRLAEMTGPARIHQVDFRDVRDCPYRDTREDETALPEI